MRKIILGILMGAFILLAYVGAKDVLQRKAVSKENTALQDQIRQTLRDELLQNPEVILEALEGLRQKQETAMRETASAAAAPYKMDLLDTQTAIHLGDKRTTKQKTLVTFLDPNCQHCRHFGMMLRELLSEFSDISLLLRYWPILGKASAEASERLMQYKDHPDLQKLLTKMDTFSDVVDAQAVDTFIKELKISKDSSVLPPQDARNIIVQTHTMAQKIGLDATPTSFLITEGSVQMIRPSSREELRTLLSTESASKVAS